MSINQNKLANDPSPYLQQHKDNPVNWQIWSKEILDTAKKKKIPVSSCGTKRQCHAPQTTTNIFIAKFNTMPYTYR